MGVCFQNIFIFPEGNPVPRKQSPTTSSPLPWQPLVSFLSLWICPSWTCHVGGREWYVACSDLLHLLTSCTLWSRSGLRSLLWLTFLHYAERPHLISPSQVTVAVLAPFNVMTLQPNSPQAPRDPQAPQLLLGSEQILQEALTVFQLRTCVSKTKAWNAICGVESVLTD